MHHILILLAALAFLNPNVMSLDGQWDIALQDEMPTEYTSVCPVPGIASQAVPALKEDLHHSASEVDYDCVWYRRSFKVDSNMKGAVLKIRAKYNAEVFLNGKWIGRSDNCTYSHASFDVSKALAFKGDNELVVKVGSWRTASFPSKENKNEWWRTSRCPGIWDSVTLEFYDSIYASAFEILPCPSEGKLRYRIVLENQSGCRKNVRCAVEIQGYRYACRRIKLRPGESGTVSGELPAEDLKLWIPGPSGNPALYTADLVADGALLSRTRFGYRDIKIDGTVVLINGRKTHFCSENIAFQRTLISWADAVMNPVWVRKFLRAALHEYGFNHLRMHLGHAPSFWYDIADEEGIMLQDEWCFMHEKDPEGENLAQTETEFRMWVKENINHPSIIAWDMENEGDVSLSALCEELKEYDPTRPWAEDDFDTQHRYEYSENIVPRPYCEPDGKRPTTVLESCRLWINPKGELEPRENFKTSRTATSWGVYYYTTPLLEQLQADIHADQGTYFRSLKVLAWAPFALLSGTVNGHNFFSGDIRDSLVARKNLSVLSTLNKPVGASLMMLQARETYKEKRIYVPGGCFSKPVVVWNDTESPVKASVKVALFADGKEITSELFDVTVPAFDAVTKENPFSLRLPEKAGEYDLVVYLTAGGKDFECFPRHICVGVEPKDLSRPFDGAISVLDHFLPGMPDALKQVVINATYGKPIDSIRRKYSNLLVRFTEYEKDSSKSFEMTIDESGKVLGTRQLKEKSSGWLQHAF
ncbi:MAG: glycoside hydrolase [Bacteroidales bacterium]|nr:glycoside hydrolase [Bacteroidales bacterium]